MTPDSFGTWIGVVIGVAGLFFAIYEWRQREKLESVVRDMLRRLAGDIRVIHSNAHWTDSHLRNIGHTFSDAEPDFHRIRRESFDAARDATACARQLGLVHSKIRGIQQTLFQDDIDKLPD